MILSCICEKIKNSLKIKRQGKADPSIQHTVRFLTIDSPFQHFVSCRTQTVQYLLDIVAFLGVTKLTQLGSSAKCTIIIR